MKWILIVALLIGLVASRPDDSYLTFKESPEINSDEVGQSRGPVATNCTCGTTNKDGGRIVGGKVTLQNEYPFMVGLGYPSPKGLMVGIFCGAALITVRHGITAAHCTFEDHNEKLALVVGEHDTSKWEKPDYHRVYPIMKIIEHEGWDVKTVQHDIAIVVTKDEIQLGKHAALVCLPSSRPNIVGQHVRVAGWGTTSSGGDESTVLRKVSLKVIDTKFCKEKYPFKKISTNPQTQLCTYSYKKDSCQGDSGGPLFWANKATNRYTLVGIVSFGSGCAGNIPGVNTDVYAYINWIQKNIHEHTPQRVFTCS